jgi:protein SCO1
VNTHCRSVLLAVAISVALAGCDKLGAGAPAAAFQGVDITGADYARTLALPDVNGQPRTLGDFKGKVTVVFFGYTQCPDVCPESMADAMLALKKIPVAVAKQTYVVFVTTDVKHDTGPVISKWLGNFSKGSPAHWVGLRGTQTQIDTAQAASHITVAEDAGKTHSAQILLYGPDDYAHVTFLQSNTEQNQIAHDLPLVAKGRT